MKKWKIFLTISVLLIVLVILFFERLFMFYIGAERIYSFDQSQYEQSLAVMSGSYRGEMYDCIAPSEDYKAYRQLFKDTVNQHYASQPIQILYFKEDSLHSHQANCHAKMLWNGNLDWNVDGSFDTYFPTNPVSLRSLDFGLTRVLETFEINHELPYPSSETIVFFWTHFMKVQSVNAFNAIVRNIEYYIGEEDSYPKIILINTDHFFIEVFDNEG